MSRRARILSFGSAAVLVAIGAVCAAVLSSTAGQVAGMVLIGLGLVLATGLVFLEVGLSEDRERARTAARQKADEERSRPPHGAGDVEIKGKPRLGRMRGSRRSLK
jgi:hypothetical protein